MTDTSGSAPEDPTQSEPQPSSFPSVGGAASGPQPMPGEPGQPLFSPAADGSAPPPAQPVEPRVGGQPTGGGGRWRWLVAGLATLLVVVLVGGALLLAAPQAGSPSAVAHYAPASSAAYMEVRLDLPGDQHDKLAAFMSHFPGFADPSTFDQKLNETLSELVASDNSGIDWTTDIEPWFGGQLAAFSMDLAGSPGTPPSFVVVMSVDDRASLDSAIEKALGSSSFVGQDYRGLQIRTVTTESNDQISYVITDDALLIGARVEDVRQALDVQAGSGTSLASDQFFLQQLGALPADRLATVYFDMGQAVAALPSQTSDTLPAACTQSLSSALKVKFVGAARAEDDHLAMTGRTQPQPDSSLPALPSNRQSVLAKTMPTNTIVYAEMRDVGKHVQWLLGQLLACMPSTDGTTDQFDISKLSQQFLGTNLEDYFDFVGDAAIGISPAGDKVEGGLAATVDDSAVAGERIDKLVSLLKAFGSTSGISTEEVDHNGTTLTIIHSTSLPEGVPDMSLAVALSGGQLLIGSESWVVTALDRQESDSLWAQDRFQKAISGANANAGAAYVDVPAMLALQEASIPASDRSQYESEAKPFLEPLKTLSIVNRVDNGILVTDAFLFVE